MPVLTAWQMKATSTIHQPWKIGVFRGVSLRPIAREGPLEVTVSADRGRARSASELPNEGPERGQPVDAERHLGQVADLARAEHGTRQYVELRAQAAPLRGEIGRGHARVGLLLETAPARDHGHARARRRERPVDLDADPVA